MQIVIILRKIFKYSTVICTFSEHITIFRTLSIDIWQFKHHHRQTNKKKKIATFFSANFSELLTTQMSATTNK